MKVKALIEELQKLPQDFDVVLSSDSEGNSYQLLRNFDTTMFMPKWSEIRDEDDCDDEEHYEKNCVVFWP